jgi:hypothetical protein
MVNAEQSREVKTTAIRRICHPVHAPTMLDGSHVMSRDKRFSSPLVGFPFCLQIL